MELNDDARDRLSTGLASPPGGSNRPPLAPAAVGAIVPDLTETDAQKGGGREAASNLKQADRSNLKSSSQLQKKKKYGSGTGLGDQLEKQPNQTEFDPPPSPKNPHHLASPPHLASGEVSAGSSPGEIPSTGADPFRVSAPVSERGDFGSGIARRFKPAPRPASPPLAPPSGKWGGEEGGWVLK